MATRDPVTILPADSESDDTENAYHNWRESLKDQEGNSTIRAYKLPFDESGRVSHSQTMQVRLGTWPLDMYDFDSLCDKLRKDFMEPGEKKMAVRLMGSVGGRPGLAFNKIVVIARPNSEIPKITPENPTGDLFRQMTEMSERNMKMIAALNDRGNAQPENGGMGGFQQQMMQVMAMTKMFMDPMVTMMQAAMGRTPAPAATGGSLKEMLESLALLDKLRGGGGGGGSDTAEIIRAVADVGTPLLAMAAQQMQHRVPARPRVLRTALPPQGAPVNTPPAGAAPTKQTIVLPMDAPTPIAPPPVAQPTPTPPPPEEAPAMFAELKPQVDALVSIAASGADATETANMFFEQTMLAIEDQNVYEQICNFVENEKFMERIAIFNSDVKKHAAFFMTMRAQVMTRIRAESDSATGVVASS